jgi:hypothetical protein
MFNRSVVLRGLVLLAGASIFSTISWADGVEVSGSGGGVTLDGGGGTHAIIGATGAYRLGDHIHLFGEFGYSTLASSSFSTSANGVTVTGNASVKLANFGGGADYSFRSSEAKVRPYITAELGVGHFYGTGSGTGSNGNSASVSIGVTNALYYGVGGGVRLYVGQHWGFKPEVRYQRYQSSLIGSNTVQYSVGLFYQFGK